MPLTDDGADDGGGRAGRGSDLPREAYALLAQANLLRMRGCWEAAVENCMAALRLAPDSPSAQSLLGDIYENQGRYDDAIQWYRMALDAHPDSPADRLKLERLTARQQALPVQASASARTRTAAADTEDVSHAPHRAKGLILSVDKALRYGAIVTALVVVVVVASAYAAVRRHAGLGSLRPTQEMRERPLLVSSSGAAAAPDDTARDTADQAALEALRRSPDLAASGVTVYDVQTDPHAGRVSVTFGLAAQAVLTRAAILKDALLTVQAAGTAIPNAAIFTARCLSASPGGSYSLVFAGDVPRSSVPVDAVAAGLNEARIQSLWNGLWWSSLVTG